MAPVKYLSTRQLHMELDKISSQSSRPKMCAGFFIAFPRNLLVQHPIPNIHIDFTTGNPISHLCYHEGTCQDFAEILYILLKLYAMGDISEDDWTSLFPSNLPGIKFDPAYPDCDGFLVKPKLGMKMFNKNTPWDISSELVIDSSTNLPRIIKCTHEQCDTRAIYMYALYLAFANDMLETLEFSRFNEEKLNAGTYIFVFTFFTANSIIFLYLQIHNGY